MRIPQVAEEAPFKHGLFSIHSIPANARAMLWEGLRVVDKRPYLIPHGFGGSIFRKQSLPRTSLQKENTQLSNRHCGLDRHCRFDFGSLAARQSRWVAVFLSLRHDPSAMDVFDPVG